MLYCSTGTVFYQALEWTSSLILKHGFHYSLRNIVQLIYFYLTHPSTITCAKIGQNMELGLYPYSAPWKRVELIKIWYIVLCQSKKTTHLFVPDFRICSWWICRSYPVGSRAEHSLWEGVDCGCSLILTNHTPTPTLYPNPHHSNFLSTTRTAPYAPAPVHSSPPSAPTPYHWCHTHSHIPLNPNPAPITHSDKRTSHSTLLCSPQPSPLHTPIPTPLGTVQAMCIHLPVAIGL